MMCDHGSMIGNARVEESQADGYHGAEYVRNSIKVI